jgi:transcriptional regulator with XRE-family HTH domain
MTGDGIDEQIDQLVKARWLAIGLSQTDLAEVLNAAFQSTPKGFGSNRVSPDRLMQVAEALDISIDSFHSPRIRQEEPDLSPARTLSSLQALLELRLLRAFNELADQRTKEVLVHLAEKIVRRQADGHGDSA